jgi:RNA polymerase sigma-70 factor (ECF subfamily)
MVRKSLYFSGLFYQVFETFLSLQCLTTGRNLSVVPANAENEDLKLVELCRSGDRIAFDRLVLKYQHRVVGMCTRLLNSREDGEDAAQECFVKVYRNISRFSGRSSFSTWLYRITVNTCRNRYRSFWHQMKKRSVALNGNRIQEHEGGDRPVELGDTRFTPVKELRRKQLGAAIAKAIGELPRSQKEVVVLRDIQGLSYEETARITGQTEGTVKSRLFRARTFLQGKLEGIRE